MSPALPPPPPLSQTSAPLAPGAEAALAAAAAERERREARYASLFDGRSAGERQQGGVPEGLPFSRLSAQVGATAMCPAARACNSSSAIAGRK